VENVERRVTVGSTVFLNKYRFLPEGRGERNKLALCLGVCQKTIMARVVQCWKLSPTGKTNYAAVIADPKNKKAQWVLRRMSEKERRVFFIESGIVEPYNDYFFVR
jgi:hypothetical protein